MGILALLRHACPIFCCGRINNRSESAVHLYGEGDMICTIAHTNSSNTTLLVVAFSPEIECTWQDIAKAGFIVCREVFPPNEHLWIPSKKEYFRTHSLRTYFEETIAKHVSQYYVYPPARVTKERRVLIAYGLDSLNQTKGDVEEAPFYRHNSTTDDIWSGICLHKPEIAEPWVEFAVCDNIDAWLIFCQTESGWKAWAVRFDSDNDGAYTIFGRACQTFDFITPAVVVGNLGIRLHRFVVERSAIVAVSMRYEQQDWGALFLLQAIEELLKNEEVRQALANNRDWKTLYVDF